MMKKRFVLVFILVLTLSSFGQAAPQRIISLVPSITENFFALGVGEQIVGVTEWCDYPAEATSIAKVADMMTLNIELILSLEPDLVVADSNLVQGHIETLQELNIPTLVVAPTTLAEVAESLIAIGTGVGVKEKGEELAREMNHRLAELTASVERDVKPRVFIEVWNEPVMTAGPGSFMDELIVLAGGQNIAFDAPTPWPTFSEEVVIERDPEVVILTNFNLEEALGRSAWQITTAMKNGDVYEVNPDLYSRTSVRILDALEELIEILDSLEQ